MVFSCDQVDRTKHLCELCNRKSQVATGCERSLLNDCSGLSQGIFACSAPQHQLSHGFHLAWDAGMEQADPVALM